MDGPYQRLARLYFVGIDDVIHRFMNFVKWTQKRKKFGIYEPPQNRFVPSMDDDDDVNNLSSFIFESINIGIRITK